MAKKSRMGKKNYTSKGQRPNVSKKTRNAVRAHKKEHDITFGLFSRMDLYREIDIKLKKGQRLSEDEKVVQARRDVEKQALKLYDKWKRVATYSACVQAVKTDWVSMFENKCQERKASGIFRI